MFDLFEGSDIIYLIIIGAIALALIILFIALIISNNKNKKIKLEPIKEEVVIADTNASDTNPILGEQIEIPKDDDISDVILAMQKDIDKKKDDPVMSFEEEQEEKAIISYRELLKTKEQNNSEVKNEIKPEIEIIDFPIEEEVSVKRSDITEKAEAPKFTNTEFISPVYGRMNQSEPVKVEPKVEAKPEVKMSVKDEKNDRFLEELKKFRSSL